MLIRLCYTIYAMQAMLCNRSYVCYPLQPVLWNVCYSRYDMQSVLCKPSYGSYAMQTMLCNLCYATYTMQAMLAIHAMMAVLFNRCGAGSAVEFMRSDAVLSDLFYESCAMHRMPYNLCCATYAMQAMPCNQC